MREFGQLRTMGVTSKQIRKILASQGKLFCVTGAVLGLIIGGIAAFFEIDLSRNVKRNDPHGQTGIQANNPLNDELLQSIMQIDGVSQITIYQNLEAQFEYKGDIDTRPITPFSPDQQSLLEKYLLDGSADYQSLISNKEIISVIITHIVQKKSVVEQLRELD